MSTNRSDGDAIVVCLAYPLMQEARFVERVRAIDARLEPILLPVDPEGDFVKVDVGDPHEEPPPWAKGVAAERREVLERSEVMLALFIPQNLMQLMPRLRWIQGLGAGVEQFARAGAERERVVVTNASGVSAGSMSEFVIGRLLQIWKRFREIEDHQHAHRYESLYGRSFAGSTLGIVGMGNIGSAVARRVRAFGVEVLAMKRSHRAGESSELADELFSPDQLHEMLARCDAVVVAAPATPETRHIIDAEALAAMAPGAVLVNVARGSLVDEIALAEALKSGRLGAAALDVFEQEPLPPGSPLWDLPNLYLSAHASVSVDRYLDDVFDLFADNLARYVEGEPLRNRVDMEALGFK